MDINNEYRSPANGEEITEHIDAGETVDRTRKVRIDATAFDHSEVQLLRQKGFDWTQVSKLLGTNRKTLQRWRERTNYEDPFRGKGHYSETELNDIVSKFSDGHWEKGERTTVIGHIRGSTDIRFYFHFRKHLELLNNRNIGIKFLFFRHVPVNKSLGFHLP